MGSWIVGFVGWAGVYSGLLVGLAIFAGHVFGRQLHAQMIILLFVTIMFVLLTQYPFPSVGQLSCPVAMAAPQFYPLSYWSTFDDLVRSHAPFSEWYRNRIVAETLMNLAVCSVIGASLALNTTRFRNALFFGFALTFSVELTQLTGMWGLYACPYRKFSVDDIILNIVGTLLGFWLSRKIIVNRCLSKI